MTLQKKQLLTALLITYNEEHNIKDVLNDLAFANEIIVVDSFSTDKTFEIAASYSNVKIIQRTFDNFASQRNFAISLASNSWIFFMDADERLTPELKCEIIEVINSQNPSTAYLIHRICMFKDKKIRFSGRQTDKIFRLFNKENAFYDIKKIVHEKLIVNGSIGSLKNKLIHFSYSDYNSYKQKMLFYGRLKAKEELEKNTNPNFFHFYVRPLYQFLYPYIIRFGFLDGKRGIIICYLNALSVAERFKELRKIKAKISRI